MEGLPPLVKLDTIQKWSAAPVISASDSNTAPEHASPFVIDAELNEKIAIWKGDQLSLEVDGVVNATSEQFNDISYTTKRIARLAGEELNSAIARLDGCRTGEAKITGGFNLHAQYVLHTVGPRYNARYATAAENALHSAYRGCMQLAKENRLETVAFCIINSEKKGYPKEPGGNNF
jgi:O-acetyl-ADP-ribose deacetylase (regulator of RNase III)